MAIYRARADLSWNPDAANVNTQLANACNNILQTGDTLVLDKKANGTSALYKVSSRNNSFKSGVTITGEVGSDGLGCGFDCIGSGASIGQPWFKALGNITLEHARHTHSETPDTGFAGGNPTVNVDYHWGTTWSMRSGTSKVIRFCSFEGNPEAFLEISGSGFDIRNTTFYHGKYQIYCASTVTSFYSEQNLFDWALIDAIKTINSGGAHRNFTINETIFQRGRDAVDVAGGYEDSTFNDVVFRYLRFTAFDAKIGLDSGTTSADWDNRRVRNVVFNDCHYIDPNAVLTTTFLNGGGHTLTPAILEAYVPRDITINNPIVERSSEAILPPNAPDMKVLFLKMGHHCKALNVIKKGWHANDDEYDIQNRVDANTTFPGWSHDYLVTTASVDPTRRARDWSVPFPVGPGGVITEPEIPSAPLSAGPAVYINSETGVLTIDRDRVPALDGKTLTIKVTTGVGSAEAPAELNVS